MLKSKFVKKEKLENCAKELYTYKCTCPVCNSKTSGYRGLVYDKIGVMKRQYWELFICESCNTHYGVPVLNEELDPSLITYGNVPQMDKEFDILERGNADIVMDNCN